MKHVYLTAFLALFVIISNVKSQNPEWVNYTNGDQITSLAEEGKYIWVGTTGGLVQLDKNTGNPIFYNKGNNPKSNVIITKIIVDIFANKWICSYYGGLTKFDGTNWTIYNTENSGLPSNEITSIASDINGNIWIGSQYNGLIKYDGKSWEIYNNENSELLDNYIHTIAIV